MTFIFIGRSGSGKGTQAELLIKYLENAPSGPEATGRRPVVYMEAGSHFRTFINQSTYSGQLAKAMAESGNRQPDFLAVYFWADFMLKNLQGGEQLVFDGTPRSLVEAQALDTALVFYGYEKPMVIFLDVPTNCVKDRLINRGRHDDYEENIRKRLEWYERDVAPVIDYYRTHSNYRFARIEGEREVELIHEEIKKFCLEFKGTEGN